MGIFVAFKLLLFSPFELTDVFSTAPRLRISVFAVSGSVIPSCVSGWAASARSAALPGSGPSTGDPCVPWLPAEASLLLELLFSLITLARCFSITIFTPLLSFWGISSTSSGSKSRDVANSCTAGSTFRCAWPLLDWWQSSGSDPPPCSAATFCPFQAAASFSTRPAAAFWGTAPASPCPTLALGSRLPLLPTRGLLPAPCPAAERPAPSEPEPLPGAEGPAAGPRLRPRPGPSPGALPVAELGAALQCGRWERRRLKGLWQYGHSSFPAGAAAMSAQHRAARPGPLFRQAPPPLLPVGRGKGGGVGRVFGGAQRACAPTPRRRTL